MICWYVFLNLVLTLLQIDGLIKGSSRLPNETREDIVMMIQNWVNRNENPILGERVYYVNVNNEKVSSGSYDQRVPESDNYHKSMDKLFGVKGKRQHKLPIKLNGYKYYGHSGYVSPENLNSIPVKLENNLQNNQIYSGNLLEDQLGSIFHDQGLTIQTDNPVVQSNKFYGDLLRLHYNLMKNSYGREHTHHQQSPPPPPPEKPQEHHHKHEHSHEHKHHHVTKTKKKSIHYVMLPIPYPVHIKVLQRHRHHNNHNNNHHGIMPLLLAAAVGLPLLLGALLLPLGLLFITTIATLGAALIGNNGIFGSNSATLIPITATTSTASGGKLKRLIRQEQIYDEQTLDSLYTFIMDCIYSFTDKSFNPTR